MDSTSRVYFYTKRLNESLTPAAFDDVNNNSIITAVKESINYEVINNTWTAFDINPRNLPQNGPIYLNTGSIVGSSMACDAAPLSANHFKVSLPSGPTGQPNSFDNAFAFNAVNQFYEHPDAVPGFPASGSEQCGMTHRYLQWHPWSFYRQKAFYVFFLKVSVPNITNTQYRIQCIARAIDKNHPFRDKIYGVRQIVIDTKVELAACVEIRRPQILNICDDDAYEIDEEFTRLELSVTSHKMIISEIYINNDTTIVYSHKGDATLTVDLNKHELYSLSQGIYREKTGTRMGAFRTAKNRCMASSDTDSNPRNVTENTYYAVRFDFN